MIFEMVVATLIATGGVPTEKHTVPATQKLKAALQPPTIQLVPTGFATGDDCGIIQVRFVGIPKKSTIEEVIQTLKLFETNDENCD